MAKVKNDPVLFLFVCGTDGGDVGNGAGYDGTKKTEAAAEKALNEELRTLLQKVQELQAKHEYFDALQELDKAEALSPDSPVFPNVRGSIYTGMRDFDKARECFELSLKRAPEAFEPRFNLAELRVCSGQICGG